MPTSDPIEILLAHDKWATQQVLNTCATLSSEKFHQRFEMGPGSLHDTTTHIVSVVRVWGDVLAERPIQKRLEGSTHTVPELLSWLDQAHADFDATVKVHPLNEIVPCERDGKTFHFTRGAIITHVATHNMHHRAQCLNMLRQVGVTEQPLSSVTQWTLHANPLR